ncbi:MAG: hypothetical protein KBD78_15820 [Oligoflexales bacterium]|nr:hypothetical protein [Oligoflexales bacterium]
MGAEVKDFNNDLAMHIVLYPYISNRPITKMDQAPMPDGNPVLYLGLVLCGKLQHFELKDDDKFLVEETYKDCKKEPGLITRGRHKFEDHESHDDRIGMSYAAAVTGHHAALDIYSYGVNHNWIFNNAGCGWFKNEKGERQFLAKLKCWDARLPGVVQHYKISADKKLNLFDKIWWAIRIGLFFPESESGIQMDWLMIDLYRRKAEPNFIMDSAATLWEHNLYDTPKYPHLMGSVFEKYFNKDHLLAKWMRGIVFKNKEEK